MMFILVLHTVIVVVICNKNDDLIAVVQVFRHGQRTPLNFYSTDPYSNLETYWSGLDYGELTNEGKRQHFALGQFTRNRYSDWLPTFYNKSIIFAQTTDVDRTHMSVQSNLYGLFHATGSQVWPESVDWQPIPIHPSNPKIIDELPSSCPRFDKLLGQATEEIAKRIDGTYSNIYEYISKNSNESIKSFFQAANLYDPLYIEQDVGLILPSWTSLIYPEPLSTFQTKVFESYSYNNQLKRLSTGVLLKTILEYFENMVIDRNSSQKYLMYSGHDSNVFAILNCIGQTPAKPLPFAVSLWFELRILNFVNVVHLWIKSGDNITQLNILNCGLSCPLVQVKTLLKDILLDVDTFVSECDATTTTTTTT